jgi:TPR repeat protein
LYSIGWQVPENKKMAAQWHRKAIRQGYAPSMFALGMMYFEGDGVKQDVEKGLAYLLRAAQQPGASAPDWDLDGCRSMDEFLAKCRGETITFAQENLGIIYANGLGGIPANLDEGVKWLTLAVEHGADAAGDLTTLRMKNRMMQPGTRPEKWHAPDAFDADELYAMGLAYESGAGGTKDIVLAVRAYLRAINTDPEHADAMYALAEIRRNANGAGYLELYERAAECGHAKSMLSLSNMYRTGQGVDPCRETARMWQQAAADAGAR